MKILNDASSAFSRHTFSTKDVSNVLVIGNESKYFSVKSGVKYDFDYEDVKTKLYELYYQKVENGMVG